MERTLKNCPFSEDHCSPHIKHILLEGVKAFSGIDTLFVFWKHGYDTRLGAYIQPGLESNQGVGTFSSVTKDSISLIASFNYQNLIA